MTVRVRHRVYPRTPPNDICEIFADLPFDKRCAAKRGVLDLLKDKAFVDAAERGVREAQGRPTVQDRQARRMRVARPRAGV